MNQDLLRKKIKEIHQNSDLSMEKKSKMIFELMNLNKNQSKNEMVEKQIECSHYNRKCKIISPCCGKIYDCRFCHDENNDHKIDRKLIKEIICKKCNKIQSVSNECIECKEKFGNYYCNICHLWINKNIECFHCEHCNICRVGKREDYIHCFNCNICAVKDHKCINNISDSKCPCCLEDIFSSNKNIQYMKCGHMIHKHCLELYLKNNYNCPLCKKSLFNLEEYWRRIDIFIENDIMPIEFRDKICEIYCNDCEIKTESKYHFHYNKCAQCNGYNTNLIKIYK